MANSNSEIEFKQRILLVEWLNSILPNLHVPIKASEEDLRALLIDGTVLCKILNRVRPGSVDEEGNSKNSSVLRSENVKRFLTAMDELEVPRFEVSDLQQGSVKAVVDCLLTLKAKYMPIGCKLSTTRSFNKSGSSRGDASSCGTPSSTSEEERQRASIELRFQRAPFISESSAAVLHPVGHKFHEVFQLKQGQGRHVDLSATKISEMMKSNTLDNAPTQSLLSVVNGILDESIERKNGEIPHRVACLLRKVVLEIERRISTQAEHLRTQNNLFKSREEKYQSRIRVLEALASGAGEENKQSTIQLPQIKTVKSKVQEQQKFVEEKRKLMEENDRRELEISTLKQELEILKVEEGKRKLKENDKNDLEINSLKQELEIAQKIHEQYRLEMESDTKGSEAALHKRLKEVEQELEVAKKMHEQYRLKMESEANGAEAGLQKRLKEVEQELEIAKKMHERYRLEMESEAKGAEAGLQKRLREVEQELEMAKKMHEQYRLEMESEAKGAEAGLQKRVREVEQELEVTKKMHEQYRLEMESEAEGAKAGLQKKLREVEQELEITKKRHEQYCLEMESEAKGAAAGLHMKLTEVESLLEDSNNKVKVLESLLDDSNNKVKKLESLLADSNNKVKELEASYEPKCQKWNMKEKIYQNFMVSQFSAMRELRITSQSIKQEVLKSQKGYSEEFTNLGVKLKPLADAAENYRELLAENQKLFNELQDLKGNIRVFCRIRPFLPGQAGRQTIVENIGENGQLVVGNPSKSGKDGQRSFKFNKVYGPVATQGEVFSDIQPFVQSVVDGYNVCIFAYGQTGSGKTYTMTGPNGATEEEWGVNYRAMNFLFKISQNRKSSISYEVGVQMIEIYNELVRDLLSSDSSQKKLGVTTIAQPNGLAVPDASMHPVRSPQDVLDLMDIGFKNRAVSATALNERSSRSHSIVTIHVRGKDLKSGITLYGNLHLVDLAGSERVDRSEVTGDRLREAQHINKSLSSLGDVVFALAQKSSHVPYRNSKLTQVLQSSLGGQAKTLMFVQLNPDVASYSESLSTLKFAERVSGIELGAARSSKEGNNVKELMDQMASLKDTIARKDEEIERLQLLKDLKNGYPGIDSEQHGIGSMSDKHSEVDSLVSLDEVSEMSDANLSIGTETDEIPLSPESPSVGRTRVASKLRVQPKPTQGRTALNPGSPKVSSLRKSLSSASLKSPVRK